ncbi:MAG: translation initiation factor IF-2 [Candidatus Kerfeldbacteria bacterium]|nr:translation initiation factor IF-2 [Candidatus Kerfeldbacteria bacterium]
MNLTELARRLKIPTEQLKDELPRLGFDIGRRAIKVDEVVAEKVIKLWSERQAHKVNQQYVVVEKRLNDISQVVATREAAIPLRLNPRELAELLNIPVANVMAELFKNGVMASINELIDFETASIIAQDLGYKTVAAKSDSEAKKEAEAAAGLLEILNVKETDEPKLQPRPPVVVVMGHVDHGKTTLLDAIRSTNVAAQESGAITQHIGAYQVEERGRKITFLDTPGHEAFSAMRSRGGRLADIAIIVVAADDGVQPQTLEAIEIAQREKLSFLIAINKIDRETADIERTKKALAELNLLPEDWGGKTICVPISAKKQQGIIELLDMVLLLSDMEKFQANPDRLAAGTIIEAKLDKGEGPVATALVQVGTLRVSDYLIAGEVAGKVKAMRDFMGQVVTAAPPAMPVRILGLKQVPKAGDIFRVVKDEKEFREVLHNLPRFQRVIALPEVAMETKGEEATPAVTLNIILKADVLGSREAIGSSLAKLAKTDVTVKVVRTGLGSITEADILSAEASHAIVVGFNVPLLPAAEILAKQKNIFVATYKVIYDLLDEVKKQLTALLKPELIRNQIGEGLVIQIFRRGRHDMIVGVRVTRGVIRPGTKAVVYRGRDLLIELKLAEMRLGKEVVGEMAEGGECGLSLVGQPLVEINDRLEIYHEEVRQRSL